MKLKLGLLLVFAVASSVLADEFDATVEEEIEQDDDVGVSVETVEEINYVTPRLQDLPKGATVHLAEHFDDVESFKKKWIKSETKKEGIDEDIAKYDGLWEVEAAERDPLRGDMGLVLKSKAKHSAIAAKLDKPFVFSERPLVVQYEVLHQNGQECGGAYLKLLSTDKQSADLRKLHDKTPYTIMFGPDKCGNDHKLHFIFRHKNPVNGTIEEKHCKKPKERLDEPFTDKAPHLYTLVVRPDNTFQISLDHKVVNEGSLLEDFTPAVNPPAEIDDPSDTKPADWDEREKIPDADARKPDDWDEDAPQYIVDPSASKPDGWLDDEPENIPDPTAEKPSDWDEEMDGVWEAPLVTNPACEDAPGCGEWAPPQISNPAFKGKWRAPLIDNPNYQGKWAPRRIPNPHYFEDKQPFKMTSIFAVGFELWSMSNQILFDNLIITDDPAVAAQWAEQTFDLKKKKMEKEADTLWVRWMKHINYSPGWWALYFCYCMIPIIIYVWYLRKRALEESLVQAFVRYTNENPWLWAVYVVVIGLPIVLIAFFCFGGASQQEKDELARKAEAKKTDEALPDDEYQGEEDANKIEEEDEDDEESEAKNDDKEDDEVSQESAAASGGGGDAPPSPRKRRPRKD